MKRPEGVPNRAARRAMGIYTKFEDRMANATGPVAIPPRVVRRHFREGILTNPKNRRERRHRARIMRAML